MKHLLIGIFGTLVITSKAYAQDIQKTEAALPQGYIGTNPNPYAPVNAEKPEDRPKTPLILQADNGVKAGEVFNVVQDKPEHPEINLPKYYIKGQEPSKRIKPE